jgi:hypothetical protein
MSTDDRRPGSDAIAEAYYEIPTAEGQAVARHILYCLAGGYIRHDDLADWVEQYHQGANRVLLDEFPVSAEGLRKRDAALGNP